MNAHNCLNGEPIDMHHNSQKTSVVKLAVFEMDVASCVNRGVCLFVYSGCDVNSTRKPGPNGEGDEEARDGQTPLHLASSWGLEDVVQCLLEFGANVNAQVSPVKLHLLVDCKSIKILCCS